MLSIFILLRDNEKWVAFFRYPCLSKAQILGLPIPQRRLVFPWWQKARYRVAHKSVSLHEEHHPQTLR